MQQNIYDNDLFFSEYKALRQTDDNYNDLLEQPAMRNLLPDLTDKSVLDLGCGFGNNCIDFINRGASRVVGVDISKNMINSAKNNNCNGKIKYLQMDMSDLSDLKQKFDFVYSSLAFHYVKDFDKLLCNIYNCMNDGGELLFSQEHPIQTCSLNGKNHFVFDEKGEAIGYLMSDYAYTGIRRDKWFVDDVEIYHRTFGDVINGVVHSGLTIVQISEPLPSEEALQKRRGLIKTFIKPPFLIVKTRKL